MADLQGFPGRFSFDESGGKQRNRYPVTLAEEQLDLEKMNAVRWQVAGLGKTGAVVSLTIDDAGAKVSGGEAWNTEDDPTRRVVITHPATGQYVIAAQASSYTDWRGDDGPPVAVGFTGALVTPQSATPVHATYTLDSATQATVYLFDTADMPVDSAFTVDIK